MPSPDRAWRRLLEAFSDAPTASGPSAEPVHASRARRLLEAFSDASPAFSPHFPPRSPGLEATIPGHALARGAVVFGVLGAVCTAWVAAATGTPAAAVVATLTFSILALLIAPQVEFARARTAALRTREQDARSAEPSDEHRESFWCALNSGERRHVRDAARPRAYGPGAPILRQGYPADYVVVILSGWTKVRVDRTGEERIVAVRGPGDLVGERALFDGDTWSATVVALDTVRALVVTAADFRLIVRRHPGVMSALEKQAHDRTVEEATRTSGTEIADTERRLAALFTTLSRARHGALPVTGRELAGWTSSSPAAVASVLNDWGGAGLVHAEGGMIDVLDPDRLERLTVAGGPSPDPAPVSDFLDRQDCTVLFAEVVGFGSRDRTEADRAAIRRTLYRSLEESFDVAGVSWAACHHEDRGDGVLLVVPPGIPASAPADPLVAALAERIARYGGEAVEAQRFQVRVAVDTGPVLAAPDGVTGAALARAARLLGADVLRRRLSSGTAVLGLIVSTAVHDLINGQAFDRVQADDGPAWLRLYPLRVS
ncbi:cyclic nucleotide-binding domain-containing protein [Actinomadura sp. BRA 177]|uniref:cyclic nucleotide-binding domain-containing protein n=1 Tax=Actinomadura sp. BRA 177 TaxID=2745202 RepID=UPI001595EB19|nr:cyclic nucleotide-binding domain-containing protein [Actinomadura sp. BRA 177]NVI87984.1 cyclic nucleotide-binding domain-containing protein [Actinomadura sp. BRA 177]